MSPLEYVIKLDDRGFSGPLGNARRGVDGLNRGVGDLSRKGAGVNSLGGAFTSLAAKIGAAFTAYKALEMGFSGLGKSIKTAADMETTSTAMRVLIGDADKSAALIQRIKKMGAETPFEFPELATAGKMLLAFGESAEAVPETLRRIGDVASGVAAPIGEIAEIYGKARTAGTLFSEDINQLTGRGIPIIREFAKILGKPEGEIKKLAEEGKITFPLLDQAFRNMTSSGGQFFGMMAEQSGTVNGLLSSLSDAANDLFLEFGKPLNDALRPVLADAISLAGELKPAIAEMGVVAGGLLATTRNFVMEAGKGGGLAAAMGEQLKLALEKAGEAIMIPIGAIGAAMPSLGKAMLLGLQPAADWLVEKFNQVALNFGALLAEQIALALSKVPGMASVADDVMQVSGQAERAARGSGARADQVAASFPSFMAAAAAQLEKGMVDFQKALQERADAFMGIDRELNSPEAQRARDDFYGGSQQQIGQLSTQGEGMVARSPTTAPYVNNFITDGAVTAPSTQPPRVVEPVKQQTSATKENTRAVKDNTLAIAASIPSISPDGGRRKIISKRDGSTLPDGSTKAKPHYMGSAGGGGLDQHFRNQRQASPWEQLQRRPSKWEQLQSKSWIPQVRSPGAAKANVEAREKMQSRQQQQQAGQNGGQSEMLSALQQIAAHTAKLKVVS